MKHEKDRHCPPLFGLMDRRYNDVRGISRNYSLEVEEPFFEQGLFQGFYNSLRVLYSRLRR